MADRIEPSPHRCEGESVERAAMPGGDFQLFIQKLRVQGLLTLGLVENPATGTRRRNLGHARALLEDLRMLREKTRGNLDSSENQVLEEVLAELGAQLRQVRE